MTIKYHLGLIQGTPEWHAARCGLLTASEMDRILTPTLKVAANDKERAHVWEIAAQRITKFVEPSYVGDDMLRGWEDEILARDLYSKHYAAVTEVGFVTNDEWGFTLGGSPDGLVGDSGLIECKSRRQRLQIETIATGTVPTEHVLQVQTLLLVTGRAWCDYVSYSGGLPLFVARARPDDKIQDAIIEVARAFEDRVTQRMIDYSASITALGDGVIPTERRETGDII
jgi:predicted phage-related endonuclease